MKDKLRKIYSVLDNKFYFRLLYLFVSFTFVTMLKCIPKVNLLSKVAILWGIVILLFAVFYDYKRRKIYRFDIFLTAFIGITFVFNMVVYRKSENIIAWIVNLILFGAIFTIDVFKNKKKLIKEMNVITWFYAILMFIASVISLMMEFANKTFEIGDYVFGFSKGGVFENENAICIAAAIAIVMSLYLRYISKNFKSRFFLVLNIVVQGVTMITYRGRSSYFILIALVYTFLFVLNKNKYLRGTLIAIPVAVLCFVSFNLQGESVRNFTSGRTSLWHCAKLVVEDHPITGVGNADFIDRVWEKSLDQDLPGIVAGGLHNIYVQIGTVNGLIALILLLLFFISIFTVIVQRLDNLRRKEKIQMTYILSILVGILCVNLFESALIYIISFISLTFWIYLGYLVSILDNKNID